MADLLDEIRKPTDYKSPDGNIVLSLELNENDFQDAPLVPEQPGQNTNDKPKEPAASQPGTDVSIKPEKVFDPEFTSEIVIGTVDTIQSTLFLALNNKKQKNKRFKNREEYAEAVRLSYLTDIELSKLDNAEEKKLLVEKLKSFMDVMTKINDGLSLDPDEILKLKRPLVELVKKSNFDIPPGLALVMVSMDILSNRVVDLIMD
jgi:hypothetical protein